MEFVPEDTVTLRRLSALVSVNPSSLTVAPPLPSQRLHAESASAGTFLQGGAQNSYWKFFPIFFSLSRLRSNVRNIWWETRLRPLHALGLESVFRKNPAPSCCFFFFKFHLGASHSFSIGLFFKSSPTTAAAAAAEPRLQMERGGASVLGKSSVHLSVLQQLMDDKVFCMHVSS